MANLPKLQMLQNKTEKKNKDLRGKKIYIYWIKQWRYNSVEIEQSESELHVL